MAIYTINEEKEEFVVGDIPSKSLEERIQDPSLQDWVPLWGLNHTLEVCRMYGNKELKLAFGKRMYYAANSLWHLPWLPVFLLVATANTVREWYNQR